VLDQTAFMHVSHLAQLKEDDLIISNGKGLIFPRGFGLGRISAFHEDGLHYAVTVKPLLDLSTIDYCYLIKKGDEF
jgi:rod shape-determining protein MreC